MSRFLDVIDKIKTEYFTFDEFPLLDRGRFPSGVLKKIEAVSEKEFGDFVATISSEEWNGALLDLLEPQPEEVLQHTAKALCLKNSKRLNRLLASLLQYHYDTMGLKQVCSFMADNCNTVKNNLFLSTFSGADDLVSALCDLLMREEGTIEQIYKKYDIATQSPLAKEGCLAYLSDCDKKGLLINVDRLKKAVELFDKKKSVPMISHYLKTLSLGEFDDEINLIIAERYGQPYDSADWNPFSSDLRDKYAQWSYLYQLKIHCESYPKKYDVLMKYFEYVRSNSFLNGSDILLMDFGWMVVVDPFNSADSFLYERDYFEREMGKWEKDENFIPIFLKRAPQVLTAREFMLSTKDAPCIQLNYEDIQYYYVQEVLDIKIGLEPDLRKQKAKQFF